MLTERTRRMRDLLRAECAQYGSVFVDLFLEPAHDWIARQPWVYFAADGLHPSAASHRYALARVNDAVSLDSVLHKVK